MRPRWFCNCRHPWCWLDALLLCKVRWVCDKHDAYITRGIDEYLTSEYRRVKWAEEKGRTIHE